MRSRFDYGSTPPGHAQTQLRRAALALPLACLALSTLVFPQVRVLTLDEAIQIAVEQNRDIVKAKEYRNRVMGFYYEQRSAALPQVALVGRKNWQFDDSFKAILGGLWPTRQDLLTAEVTVSQVIFTWGQVGAAIRAARENLAQADDQLRVYQNAAARDVSSEFYNVLLARALRDVAIQNLKQRERHLEEAKRRYAAGVATDYDILAAEVAVSNAGPALVRAENLILRARDRLQFLLALETGEVDVTGKLEAVPSPYPSFDQAVTAGLNNRPEASALGHQAGVAKELIKVAGAGNKPRVDFNGTAGFRQLSAGDFAASGKSWTAAVTVNFPFLDSGKTKGLVMQAESNLADVEIDQAKLRDSIALDIRDAINAVRESEEILKGLSGTVSQAERLLTMAEKGFELGVKTRLEVQDAQDNLVQARGNLALAERDYKVARVNLEWAMGTIR